MTSDARIVGLDPQGRVVVYSSFSHTTERSPAKVTEVTVTMMEKACQCMAAHTPSQVTGTHTQHTHIYTYTREDAHTYARIQGACKRTRRSSVCVCVCVCVCV